MSKLLLILAVLVLPGCAYFEGQRVINDPDCSFIGKPAEWRWPEKCGVLPRGETVYIRKTGPNSYYISK